MNANDEEMMVTAVELMSNDKLYNLFEIVIREMNARKMKPKAENEI